jgi:hypothetical protein
MIGAIQLYGSIVGYTLILSKPPTIRHQNKNNLSWLVLVPSLFIALNPSHLYFFFNMISKEKYGDNSKFS